MRETRIPISTTTDLYLNNTGNEVYLPTNIYYGPCDAALPLVGKERQKTCSALYKQYHDENDETRITIGVTFYVNVETFNWELEGNAGPTSLGITSTTIFRCITSISKASELDILR